MYPEPRELTNAAEVRANRRDVRARLRSLPAYVDPQPAAQPEPEPEPAPKRQPPPPPSSASPEPPQIVWRPAPAIRIRKMVADHYGLTLAEITSPMRITPYLLPRYIAMYLCVRYASLSSPAVGRLFGDRDHSTVISAVRKAKKRIETDEKCAAEVAEFGRQIEAWE